MFVNPWGGVNTAEKDIVGNWSKIRKDEPKGVDFDTCTRSASLTSEKAVLLPFLIEVFSRDLPCEKR